jgi:amidase
MRGHDPVGSLLLFDLAVAGPMGRTAEDLRLGLSVVAGPDDYWGKGWSLELPDPGRLQARDLRVAVMAADPNGPVEEAYATRIEEVGRALESAGATVSFGARPEIDTGRSYGIYARTLFAALAPTFPPELRAALEAGAAALDSEELTYSAEMMRGVALKHHEWLALQAERLTIRQAWAAFFKDWDVVLAPVTATAAFPHDHSPFADRTLTIDGRVHDYSDLFFWPNLFTLASLPVTVVPAGLSPRGLPFGVQIAADHMQDYLAIEVGRIVGEVFGGFVPPPLDRLEAAPSA